MKKTIQHLDQRIRQLIGVLLIILIIAIGFFVADIREVRHTGMPHPRNPLKIISSGAHILSGEQSIQSVEDIQSWMTFAYINFTFGIPNSWLRDELDIDSPKYPQISIRSYVKSRKIDSEVFLATVKETIQSYILSHPKQP